MYEDTDIDCDMGTDTDADTEADMEADGFLIFDSRYFAYPSDVTALYFIFFAILLGFRGVTQWLHNCIYGKYNHKFITFCSI